MKYSLHQLQVFLTVCRHQNITRAAEELDLTQPAVSIQLKNFQDQFHIPLTETIGRRMYITDFGNEIAQVAENILHEVEVINAKALGYRENLSGRLRISVVSTGKYVMPYFLSSFLQKYNGVELTMDVTNREKVLNDLAKNEVDFALVSLPPGKIQVDELELLPNKLFLIGNTRQRLGNTSPSRELFQRWPLILRERGSGTRLSMEKYLERNRIIPARKLELTSNEAVKQAVLSGIGLSIMPIIGLKHELNENELNIIPYRGLPIRTSWNLVWRKKKAPGPIALQLLEHLKQEKKRIISEHFSWYLKYL